MHTVGRRVLRSLHARTHHTNREHLRRETNDVSRAQPYLHKQALSDVELTGTQVITGINEALVRMSACSTCLSVMVISAKELFAPMHQL